MSEPKSEDPKPQEKPGPEPERLKIEGNWEEALKHALEVEPPKAPETNS